jgi:hypothetical protein
MIEAAHELVEVHVDLLVELMIAAQAGDADARRIALAAWRPTVEALVPLIPLIAEPIDEDWNYQSAVDGLARAIAPRLPPPPGAGDQQFK